MDFKFIKSLWQTAEARKIGYNKASPSLQCNDHPTKGMIFQVDIVHQNCLFLTHTHYYIRRELNFYQLYGDYY